MPGVLNYAELPELIGLIAPRPLFIESGRQDPIFPIETVEAAIQYLRELYTEVDFEERFGNHLFDGVHEVNGSRAYPWLVKVIGGQSEV
jgi:predicted esterase